MSPKVKYQTLIQNLYRKHPRDDGGESSSRKKYNVDWDCD